jgi:hypothetical protein
VEVERESCTRRLTGGSSRRKVKFAILNFHFSLVRKVFELLKVLRFQSSIEVSGYCPQIAFSSSSYSCKSLSLPR